MEPLKALGYEWDVPSAAEWRAEPDLLEMLKILPRQARAATAHAVCHRTDQALHKVILGNGAIQGVPRRGTVLP